MRFILNLIVFVILLNSSYSLSVKHNNKIIIGSKQFVYNVIVALDNIDAIAPYDDGDAEYNFQEIVNQEGNKYIEEKKFYDNWYGCFDHAYPDKIFLSSEDFGIQIKRVNSLLPNYILLESVIIHELIHSCVYNIQELRDQYNDDSEEIAEKVRSYYIKNCNFRK